MPTFTMTKLYADNTVLTEAQLDAMKTSTETFLNTTKIDDDNIQNDGISSAKLDPDVRAALVPTATVFPYAGSSAPTGYLFCDGSAISRTTYSALFTVISVDYGVGDGSTTFNLPDLRGRVAAGKDNMDNIVGTGGGAASRLTSGSAAGVDGSTLGASGGAQEHSLTAAQNGTHSHTAGSYSAVSTGDHAHRTVAANDPGLSSVPLGGSTDGIAASNTIGSADAYRLGGGVGSATIGSTSTTGAHSHTVSGTSSSSGSGNAHTNVQPTLVLNYIIKY